MSRIGRKIIPLGSGVSIAVKDGNVTVQGPKGKLSTPTVAGIDIAVENGHIVVSRQNEQKQTRSFHGMMRALIANMVTGVTTGFKKDLEIVGVGYRAEAQGPSGLRLNLGFSQPVNIQAPEGITFEVPVPTQIVVSGIDKEVVGQVAANIRSIRKPEPYKGKGVRYAGERVLRKAGKAGKK